MKTGGIIWKNYELWGSVKVLPKYENYNTLHNAQYDGLLRRTFGESEREREWKRQRGKELHQIKFEIGLLFVWSDNKWKRLHVINMTVSIYIHRIHQIPMTIHITQLQSSIHLINILSILHAPTNHIHHSNDTKNGRISLFDWLLSKLEAFIHCKTTQNGNRVQCQQPSHGIKQKSNHYQPTTINHQIKRNDDLLHF